MKPEGARRFWVGFAVVLGSTILALGLAEVAIGRFWPVHHRQPPGRGKKPPELFRAARDPGLIFELTPHADLEYRGARVTTNSFGLRGKEPIQPKPDSTLRIAVLGDSFTFGLGVPDDLTFPAVLERLLNESGDGGPFRYEVLNFGVGAYSTQDEAIVLERKAFPLDPDLIVVAYFLNDPEIDPINEVQQYFRKVAWWERWHLGRLVARALDDLEAGQPGGGDYYRNLHSNPRKWGSVVRSFRTIARETANRGIGALVVVLPEAPYAGSWESYAYRDLHDQVRREAREAGLDVLDPLDFLTLYPPKGLRTSKGDHHLNDIGLQLLAMRVNAYGVTHHEERFGRANPALDDEREAAKDLLDAAPGYGFRRALGEP